MSLYNSILAGITNALYDEFSSDASPITTIYTETIPQGFTEPCFFVEPVAVTQEKRIHREYDRSYSFDVMFFPADSTCANEQMTSIGDRLLFALEMISISETDRLRGASTGWRLVDGVMHFSISYNPRVLNPPPSDPELTRATLNGQEIPNRQNNGESP